MCDYSLHGIPNRLAEQDEVLVVHRFHTGSKGLTSPEYLKPAEPPKKGLLSMLAQFSRFPAQPKVCAVCIPDGARLMLQEIAPALQHAHGFSTNEAVIFRQLTSCFSTTRIHFSSMQRSMMVSIPLHFLLNCSMLTNMLHLLQFLQMTFNRIASATTTIEQDA